MLAKIRRELKRDKLTVREIAEATGYTTSRVYQLQKAMIEAGELVR
jgi:DNA-binding IclR family transcriptional regulator